MLAFLGSFSYFRGASKSLRQLLSKGLKVPGLVNFVTLKIVLISSSHKHHMRLKLKLNS